MAKKRRKPNRPRNTPSPRPAATKTAERPAEAKATERPSSTQPKPSPRAGSATPSDGPSARSRAEKKELARETRERARKQLARQQRMRRLAWAGGLGVLIAAGVLFFTRESTTTRPSGALLGELQTEAPWPANGAEAQARADAIGLPPESPIVMHEHANVQIFVHGASEPIPTDVGIDPSGAQPYISSLHTHDDTGTVHMESSVSRTFTLGEFFDIWGVRLSPSCMGAYCNDATNTLQVFVDGKEVTTPIRDVAMHDQQVIVITYGAANELPDPIPATFDFSSVPQ
jgi:hypothetical protein